MAIGTESPTQQLQLSTELERQSNLIQSLCDHFARTTEILQYYVGPEVPAEGQPTPEKASNVSPAVRTVMEHNDILSNITASLIAFRERIN